MKLWNLNYDPIVDHFFLHKIGTLSSNSLDIMLLTARESIQMSYSSTRLTQPRPAATLFKKGGGVGLDGALGISSVPATPKRYVMSFFLNFHIP